jgi:hypothetical protein
LLGALTNNNETFMQFRETAGTEYSATASGGENRTSRIGNYQCQRCDYMQSAIMFQTCEVNMESKYTSRYAAGFEPERPDSISENLLPGDPLPAVKTPGKPPGKQPPPIKPPGPKRPPVKPPKPDDPPIQPPGPGKPPAEPPDPGRPPVKPPDDPSPIQAALRIGMD